MRYFFLVILLVFALVPQAYAINPRLLDYRIEIHFGWPLSGKINERVRQLSDGTWQVERNGLIFGFTMREVSKFKIIGTEVQSAWYTKDQAGIPGDTLVEIAFPANTKDVYDPISLAFKIGADLSANPRIKQATYKVSEKQGKVKNISFKFHHNQIIDADIGKIRTVRVDQQTDSDTERAYWLATDIEYIIIRAIERDDDGDIKTEINIRNGSVGNISLKAK